MIKLTDILFEIKVVNPNNKKYQEIWDKCWDDAMDEIAMYDDDDDTEIVNEDDVSDLARHLFYELTGKKVDDLDLQEIKVNRPPKMWDIDKPGVKFGNIKVGDIIQFTLYQPYKERVKQQVIKTSEVKLWTKDLDKNDHLTDNEDVWFENDLETYYQVNKVDEIKVVNPNHPKEFPIKITKENYHIIFRYLDRLGYKAYTGRSLLNIKMDERFNIFDHYYISYYEDDYVGRVVLSNPEIFKEQSIRQTISPVKNQNLKEIKINQPIVIKNFPIILTKDNVDKVFKFLNDLGYTWAGGDSLLIKDHIYDIITDKLSNDEKIYLSVDYENEIYYSEEKDVITNPERLKIIPIKRQDLDEIKVIQPKQIKIPLIINSKEEYKKLIPYLNTQGYTWMGGPFEEDDLTFFITFPIKFEFNDSDKDLRLY